MSRLIIIVLFLTQLSGCVGAGFKQSNYYSYDIPEKLRRPNDRKDIKDGKVRVQEKKEWCGPSIALIIPIPLMLKVCESYKDLIYKDGIVVRVEDKFASGRMYACGPFMWVGGIGHGYKDHGVICGSFPL